MAKALRGQPVTVPLVRSEGPRGASVHRIDLYAPLPETLLAHAEFHVFLSPIGARLRRAELLVVGTACSFRASARADLVDGELALRRGPECGVASGSPSGQLLLTLELSGGGEVSIWAVRAGRNRHGSGRDSRLRPDGQSPSLARILRRLPGDGAAHAAPGLRLADRTGARLARGAAEPRPRPSSSPVSWPSRWGGPSPEAKDAAPSLVLRSALGAACFAGALGLLYAVIAPPLSAPDEPYHLLGFAELNREASLAAGIPDVDEADPFPPDPATSHGAVPDDRHRATHSPTRTRSIGRPKSRCAARARRCSGGSTVGSCRDQDRAPDAARRPRAACVVVRDGRWGWATGLAVACAPVPYPQLLCLPFLFVPTLPFFAMHFSETALLTSVYVLLASSVAVMFLDGPRAAWAGFPLGLSTALMLAGARSPWPLAGVVGAALVARVLLGSGRREGRDALGGSLLGGLRPGGQRPSTCC